MTKSKIVLYFCLAFVGGIFLSSLIPVNKSGFLTPHLIIISGGLILGILLISLFWPFGKLRISSSRKKVAFIGFCILFLVAGIWRYQTAELVVINNEFDKYNDNEQDVNLKGIVVQEPDVRETNTKLVIEIEGIKGKILATAGNYPEYRYGDKLSIKGKLQTPVVFEDFNYKNYLAKDGIYSVIYYPELQLIENNKGNLVYAKILDFKDRLRKSIYQNLSPPQSSILGAMILGDKRQISDEWKTRLNIAGVRHITAVSGLHVAILTSILMTLLIGLGFWRHQAFYFAIILIALFIIMTGLQPSAVRAGIMGGLFLLAQYLGRLNISSRAVVFAATLMLFMNPLLLKLDVGFQLSFLAMMGIIYLLPFFQNLLNFIPSKSIKGILSMTFSAYIFTLPILIYNFGYISLVAPITNLLIVPLLPLIMALGFIFALAGMVFQPLGWILSWPVWLLLTYLTKAVDFFSQSWAFKTLENVHWIWLIVFYLILGFIVWRLQESQKLKFLKY